MTQLSVLKIVYFAHGWYLVNFDQPLVKQPIEAWEHGPVIKVVRDAFKDFGKNPISRRAERLNLETGEFEEVSSQLADRDAQFVSNIFWTYIQYDAIKLSLMTHDLGSPWDKVWNPEKAIGRLGLRIRNEDIKNHFTLMSVNNRLH